ncbi:hypothetical protein TNCT_680501 [Trichonephila clavata]|uniref:Uncharacterized protein n=1 Tax=Trichonephila clavata TaxID=2740835 RepID=A0A8X6I3C0_TRICU|nr:hypothetical protein TNCT_680501 [Trichonephila clavata]
MFLKDPSTLRSQLMDESCPQNWRWLFLRDMTNCGWAKGVPKTASMALGWSIPFGRDPDHVDGTSDTTDTNSEPGSVCASC